MNKRELNRQFCAAINSNDAETLHRLIGLGADVNIVRSGRESFVPLWLAVNAAGQEISKNFKDLATGLAELLPIVPRRDHATKREEHLRCIKMLIEAKADVNRLSHGSTPLRLAVHWRDLEVVKLLLSHGANPNAETFSVFSDLAEKNQAGYCNTVLHEAVIKGSLPVAEELLAAGADPNRTDHEGKTPLAIAQKKGFKDLVALLEG